MDGRPLASALADLTTPRHGAHLVMIPRGHFTRIADKQDVDAKTVERDYVLAHVLGAIGLQPGRHGLVFKGGTALRLCYFEDYRYSADLDFSLHEDTDPREALAVVKAALQELTQRIGFPHIALTEDERHIEYIGPLGKQRDLKLDIATDELVKETATLPLLARYRDQPHVQVGSTRSTRSRPRSSAASSSACRRAISST